MRVEIEGVRNPNNPIDKNCLKRIMSSNYIDVANDITFKIYDDSGFLGEICGALGSDKAGIIITRFHPESRLKSSQEEAVFSEVFRTIFNHELMGQTVLQIYLWVEESKMKRESLIHMGAIGCNYPLENAALFKILNPEYTEIVTTRATNEDAKSELIWRYNRHQQSKDYQKKYLQEKLSSTNISLEDETEGTPLHEFYKNMVQYLTEAISALGDTTPPDDTLKVPSEPRVHKQR